MKTKSITNAGMFASILFLLLFAVNGYSQTGYNCYIKNVTTVDSKTIHFDVWLESTGGANIALQALQAGVNFNYDSLANGGTITGSFVTGSADGSFPTEQQTPNWKVNATSHQIQLFAAIAKDVSDAATVPASGGIKIGTFELKNTVDFSGATPNFSWSFAPGSIIGTKTMVTCYVNGASLATNITVPAHHIVAP